MLTQLLYTSDKLCKICTVLLVQDSRPPTRLGCRRIVLGPRASVLAAGCSSSSHDESKSALSTMEAQWRHSKGPNQLARRECFATARRSLLHGYGVWCVHV
jgi:hypothetical protein